jgi:glycosyltransferase involved in cell wall biosynthesis
MAQPYSEAVRNRLLSVIVPTRDRPEFLPDAVGSVLRQTFTDLEVLVVDDGSGPEGAAAAARVAERDDRVRLLRLDASTGASAARNRALQQAQGELVGFLDDDDEWAPDAAEVAVAHLRERPELGGVSSWHLVVPDTGRAVVHRGPLEYGFRDLLWCNFPAVPFAVLRRDVAADELRFDEGLITCEDWDLFLRCSRNGRLETIPRVLYHYRHRAAPRVTASNARRVEGYERFTSKHAAAMTAACVDYHRARVRIMATRGLKARARLAADIASGTPRPVAAVIARESLSARIGALTTDPGRSARTLLSALRRVESATASRGRAAPLTAGP